jgi:hypothetical protein
MTRIREDFLKRQSDSYGSKIKNLSPSASEWLYLGFFGGANMAGTSTDGNTGGDEDYDGDVQVWDSVNRIWKTARLDLTPFAGRVADFNGVPDGTTDGNNNIAFHTSKRIVEITGRKVRIFFLTHPENSIDNWLYSESDGDNFRDIQELMRFPYNLKLDAVFFYQGESNNGDAGASYAGKLKTLKEQFLLYGLTRRSSFFIGAEASPFSSEINDVFYTYPEYFSYIRDNFFSVVRAEDLEYWDIKNNRLTPDGILDISDRFATEFANMPKSSTDISGALDVVREAHVWDEQNALVNGGAAAVGLNTRVLNTFNDPSGVIIKGLTSNIIWLTAGSYYLRGWTTVADVSSSQTYLRDVSDNSILAYGSSSFAGTGDTIHSNIEGYFELEEDSFLKLDTYAEAAKATDGLGKATSNIEKNVYSWLEFTKKVGDFEVEVSAIWLRADSGIVTADSGVRSADGGFYVVTIDDVRITIDNNLITIDNG